MSEARPHSWSIDEREYARHEQRRGRRFAYEDLDPRRTALVVVDVVPFFAGALRVVPNINLLARAVRAAGGTVAWVLPEVGAPSEWAIGFYGPAVAELYAASAGTGSPRERLFAELDPRDDDVWAEKSAASAFFPARSTLPAALAERHVDTVLITGTVTSVCCESSARDAATLGYRVVFVADGTADVQDSAHNAALRTVYRSFGDVRPTSEVLDLITSAASCPGARVPRTSSRADSTGTPPPTSYKAERLSHVDPEPDRTRPGAPARGGRRSL